MDSIVTALALLEPGHADPLVRKYAVLRLRQAPDSDLEFYLLQLVQVTMEISSVFLLARSSSSY